MAKPRGKIAFSAALRMIGDYAGSRLREQLKSVSFIVVYLLVFQLLVFGTAPAQAMRVAIGIGMFIIGLAFFLEGLFLGLMPLGDRVGIRLPAYGGLAMLIPFGLLLGLGSTLAEPAIAGLRVMGGELAAWEAPILFFLLERNPQLLIIAIGTGVGIAVAIGTLRFYIGFSIKPLILSIIPILLLLSFLFSLSEKLSPILGLAWDSGAITTGPVTVPLILALGIGASRSSGKGEKTGNGFGIVMLASALPILGVLILGLLISPKLPAPSTEEDFFSPTNRDQVIRLFANEDELKNYGLTHAGESGLKILFEHQPPGHSDLLKAQNEHSRKTTSQLGVLATLRKEMPAAARSVLPLTALLGAVLFLLLRDRPRHLDEVVLGIVFALIGMVLLTSGIQLGLRPLGNESGRRLNQLLSETEMATEQIVIREFDPAVVFTAAGPEQENIDFFHYFDGKQIRQIKFNPEWHDPDQQIYKHQFKTSPLIHPKLSNIGILLILVFAFGMGYGTTIAEPALRALGKTVESLTVSTIKGVSVVRAVSIGVGIGLVVGVIRIIFEIPTIWVLLPPYLLLLPLTLLNEEDFVGIAWDSGGVTTGPVTVPLVLTIGVGLGAEMAMADSFAILAMASAYPIVSVLLFGFFVKCRQRNIVLQTERETGNA